VGRSDGFEKSHAVRHAGARFYRSARWWINSVEPSFALVQTQCMVADALSLGVGRTGSPVTHYA
jgi:hypothetical protein